MSSTCYDLAQVRADLRDFIGELGYTPFLSEFASFPVDLSTTTAENCVAAVEKHADLFVLVVGGRYGSTMPGHDRSITNVEYLTARRLGVPVYAFVLRSVLEMLPAWKDNPTGDFSRFVESPKVFEFVEELRGAGGVWVFSFDRAQDIVATLREQLAVLAKELLDLRRKVVARPFSPTLGLLAPTALRLALEQPPQWEIRLFHAVLADELERRRSRRFDLLHGLDSSKAETLDERELPCRISPTARRLAAFIGATMQVIDSALPAAMGPPGTPGDAEELVFSAQRLAACYEDVLDVALDVRHLRVDEETNESRIILAELARVTEEQLGAIESFAAELGNSLHAYLAGALPKDTTSVRVVLTIPPAKLDGLNAAMRSLCARYGIEYNVGVEEDER